MSRFICIPWLRVRESWKGYYSPLGLDGEVMEYCPESIDIANAIWSVISKKGFWWSMFFPPVSVQEKLIQQLINTLKDQIDGSQFCKIWFSPWTVGPAFEKDPEKSIETLNRPDGPYLVFSSCLPEVPKETLKFRSAEDTREDFKKKGETGLTLFEYLVFHRYFFRLTKSHPDMSFQVWLLDSRLRDDSQILVANSEKHPHDLKIWAWPKDFKTPEAVGARSCMIFPL